jgi:hypothetical protein
VTPYDAIITVLVLKAKAATSQSGSRFSGCLFAIALAHKLKSARGKILSRFLILRGHQ